MVCCEYHNSGEACEIQTLTAACRQQGTPWSDGVPGLSQSPIHPGDTFVYKFKATPAGNHWYHSHEKMSLVDGLYGAIYIR